MRRAISALLAGLLAVSAIGAVAPGDVTAELSPREGRTAVSTTGDSNQLFLGGQVPAGSEPTATLQALDHADAVVETWDVSDAVVVTDGTVSGSVTVQCFYVPDCPGTAANSPEREAALAALGGYRLMLTVEDVSDLSDIVEFDPHRPRITMYALTSPTTIEVRFSEDVVDPEGDAAADWEVDDARQVYSVQGVGDTRVLTVLTPYADGDTPEVFYLPTPSVDSENLPNRPYLDRAGNWLDADGRLGLAADRIPPPVPSIDQIEGTDVTYSAQDQAVPVLGNDPTPEVVVGNVPDGAIAQLFLDDGDGTFEPGDDTLIGEAAAGGGSATIETDALPADGVHRFYARSRDEALCDPDDPSAGTCPNHSGRSEEGRYDLDTVAPTPVGDAVGHSSTIALLFTEPLIGADGAGQWTVTNPGSGPVTVDSVSGSGDSRTLQFSGGPLVAGATLDWTPPGSDPYRDEHGNVLTGFPIDVEAAELPVLEVVAPDDVLEGDPPTLAPLDPAPTLDFTLRVSDIPAGEEVDVAYTTVAGPGAGDDATPDQDYASDSGTVTITGVDGPEEAVVSVTVTRDLLDEYDEHVFLQVSNVDDGAPQFTLPGGATALTTGATIVDDDDPVAATISPASADVGENDTATLAVQLDTASGKPVTIDWATVVASDPADGQAGVADVPAQSGSVTIPAGQDGQDGAYSFEVEVADDAVDEPNETFAVDLAAPDGANATLGDPASATLTILDDDVPVPTLTVEPGSVDEDDYLLPLLTNAELPFTFRLSQAPEQAIEVSWATDDAGLAREDVDFSGDSGFVRFEAGETEQQVLVDVIDDDLDEHDETVALRVADPAAAELVDAADEPVAELTAMGTILDDDPLVTVDLGEDQEVTEGDPATFEVTLSAVSGKDIELRYRAIGDGSAVAGEDFEATDDTLTIPAGDTSRSFTIPIIDDAVSEPTEDLSVQLSVVDADTAELGRSTGTITITDDDLGVDPPDPTAAVVSLTGAAVEEGDPVAPLPLTPGPVGGNSLDFEVRLSEPADGDVVIDYETRAGTATAEGDFAPDDGQVTIPDGQQQATVSIGVVADFTDEFDEDLQLVLTGVSGDAVLPDGELARTGRILDDDPAAQLQVADATVLEGGVAELDVTLDNASGKAITVAWELVDGTATAGADYAADSGTLSFPAGTTSRTVQVATLADDDTGELIEQFELVLSDAVNAGIGDGSGTISIVDVGADGLPTTTAVFLEDATTEETDSDSTVLVPVRLSSPSDTDTTVMWSTQQLTATDGEDYRGGEGEVTIPAGETEAFIAVTIIGDAEAEPNEDFLVVLTEADSAVITGPTGRVTITDDDADGGTDDGNGGGGDGDGGSDGGGGGSSPGGGGGVDGAPDGGAGQLPVTGGGAGGMAFVLALLAARRRRG